MRILDKPEVVELYETSRELVSGLRIGLCELLRSDSTATAFASVGESMVSDSVRSEPPRLLGGVVVVVRLLDMAETRWPGTLTVMCCSLKDLP